jgi:hypothetical protein
VLLQPGPPQLPNGPVRALHVLTARGAQDKFHARPKRVMVVSGQCSEYARERIGRWLTHASVELRKPLEREYLRPERHVLVPTVERRRRVCSVVPLSLDLGQRILSAQLGWDRLLQCGRDVDCQSDCRAVPPQKKGYGIAGGVSVVQRVEYLLHHGRPAIVEGRRHDRKPHEDETNIKGREIG